MSKRIIITLDDEEYKIFSNYKGGVKDATKAKNIIMTFLNTQTYAKDYSMSKK